jgi:hypothetical protein
VIGGATSIGHQDVNAPKVRHSSVDNCFAVFTLLHVSSNEVHIGTSIEFVQRALSLGLISAINDNLGTFVEEGFRNGEADSSGTSGNTSDFSIK